MLNPGHHGTSSGDACTGIRQNVFDTLMDYVFPRFARIRTTDQLLQMMRG